MTDGTYACTEAGFRFIQSELAFQTNTVAKLTASNVRYSSDAFVCKQRLDEVQANPPVPVGWIVGSVGAGALLGLILGIVLS